MSGYYTFPPNPSSKHLELEREPTQPGQVPEPAPPLPHVTPYMDIVGLKKAKSSSDSPRSAPKSPDRNSVQLPWKKDPRPQDGIASGLATTLGFGAAAAPGGAVESFKPTNSDGKPPIEK